MTKSVSYGNSHQVPILHLLSFVHQPWNGRDQSDQLLTGVNNLRPRTLVIAFVPFLGATTHLSGVVGSEGNMLEMAMSGNGPCLNEVLKG